ncbi:MULTISPECIES: hypothetical protein [Methylobacterium]|uniref:hypothetical protein n=1 Tax=Methylobacterium TaxID=407 RepID=UPI0013ECA523|nr:hypothetical protein [Methylobacterium sp. DB0501]NGM35851.1 hypothetical protein [Methylobacterium sp. DB0501]
MRHALALFFLLGSLTGAALAQGAPRSVGDCERIKGDLAYNQCLSLFGPAAKSLAAAAVPAATTAIPRLPEPPSLGEAAEPAAPRGRRGWTRRLRGGRQSATFAVISGGGEGRHYRRRRHR